MSVYSIIWLESEARLSFAATMYNSLNISSCAHEAENLLSKEKRAGCNNKGLQEAEENSLCSLAATSDKILNA